MRLPPHGSRTSARPDPLCYQNVDSGHPVSATQLRSVATFRWQGAAVPEPRPRPEYPSDRKEPQRRATIGLSSSDDGALFIPLDVASDPCVPAIPDLAPSLLEPTPVELRLRSGRCLRFDSTMDPVALTSLIRAVEAA